MKADEACGAMCLSKPTCQGNEMSEAGSLSGTVQALIVAHGQPSNPAPAEAALAEVCTRVQARLGSVRIGSATMAAPDRLEAALDGLAEGALVYPMFMSDGWFVRTALAKRLEGRAVEVLAPLGLDPSLVGLAAAEVGQAVERAGWLAADTHILLAAHGSGRGRPQAAASARAFAQKLDKALANAGINVAFLEEPPFVEDIARPMPAQSVCLPFFAMDGDHVRCDVRHALNQAAFTGPFLPAFAHCDGVPAMIAATIGAGLSQRKA